MKANQSEKHSRKTGQAGTIVCLILTLFSVFILLLRACGKENSETRPVPETAAFTAASYANAAESSFEAGFSAGADHSSFGPGSSPEPADFSVPISSRTAGSSAGENVSSFAEASSDIPLTPPEIPTSTRKPRFTFPENVTFPEDSTLPEVPVTEEDSSSDSSLTLPEETGPSFSPADNSSAVPAAFETLPAIPSAVSETSEVSSETPTAPFETSCILPETSAPHMHEWVPVTAPIHVEAETAIMHHEDEYETIWITDREAWEETVEVSPAWEEEVTEVHTVCNECGFDFTAHAESGVTPAAHSREHVLAGGFGGWHTEAVVVNVIRHEAEYQTVRHGAEGHFEQQLIREAWDETVEIRPAHEEEIIIGYRCPICGAEK